MDSLEEGVRFEENSIREQIIQRNDIGKHVAIFILSQSIGGDQRASDCYYRADFFHQDFLPCQQRQIIGFHRSSLSGTETINISLQRRFNSVVSKIKVAVNGKKSAFTAALIIL